MQLSFLKHPQLPEGWLNKGFGIAFSGGSDSLALAHKLRHKKPTLYHFNHRHLPDGGDDYIARDCTGLAKELDLPIVVGTYTGPAYKKGSVEAWCREQRYEWFSGLDETLLMAHHLSDSCENYLANCFKGCPEYLPIPVVSRFGSTTVFRPLIATPKQDIQNYLIRNKLIDKIVSDPLNYDNSKMRNWIRLSLLPQIKERTNLEKVVKKRYIKFLTTRVSNV